MGSEDQHFGEQESSEDDESENPPGYYNDSDSCEEVEAEYHGHLAFPSFSPSQLEQDATLDTGFQGDSYGGVLEPPLGEDFPPQHEFSVGTVSFVDEPNSENENLSETEERCTAEEWAAWESGANDSGDTGGADFYDEGSYYGEEDAYYSDGDYD
ncbi:hypothetical protein CYMTET_32524 [Cymbomonas tetramitiformis]|uniref:Uncharacterized protein n=1 Tax=Cymbomonas tetramitiformis TaxID=36881 RepID=A0AAE0KRV4_9CHLO|nr:hypothetical protein CYMTET_32524 [Cymbomonas tetramitiformis]